MVKVTGDFNGAQQCGLSRSPIIHFVQNYKYAMIMAIAMIVIFLLTFYCKYLQVLMRKVLSVKKQTLLESNLFKNVLISVHCG